MTIEKTYLELSDADAHKFYEVTLADCDLTIRYGRIGDPGQSKTTTYPTPEKAAAEAQKKIKEKQRKGYAAAVMGERSKRPITRRSTASSPSSAKPSPLLWKFASGDSAFGIFIDTQRCWLGNQQGKVFALDHQGAVITQYQLPEGVKCIVSDDRWLYAGCDDGNVYNLNAKIPHVAYEIEESVDIFWLDIYDGTLAVSDAKGGLTVINPEGETQWTRLSPGEAGWMVRSDRQGFYHGHRDGVTMYDPSGRVVWQQPTTGGVLFGWQEAETVYAGSGGQKIHAFTKTGVVGAVYKCDAAVFSCATAVGGEYVFAGDSYSSVYCFNQQGDRLWKLGTSCGSALSMQFWQDRIYIVTSDGYLACIDVSAEAIAAAQSGVLPKAVDIKAPKGGVVFSPTTALETTTDTTNGVMVECFAVGEKLRVRVITPGFNPEWKVQFPRQLRELGAKYMVEEIQPAANGNFYRAYGEIKKLV